MGEQVMSIVYKITNILNGKFYIGKTTNYYKRMWAHQHDRRRITPFTKAVDKYGWDNFIQEVLWDGDIDKLEEMEMYYINEYDAIKKGYNCTIGGDGYKSGVNHPFYGKKLSPEWSKHISEGKKVNHPLKGKKLPPEWAKKIHNSLPSGENSSLSKKYKITSPTGEVFEIKGLNKFCKENNLESTLMSHVAVGKRKHHKGWKCEYA